MGAPGERGHHADTDEQHGEDCQRHAPVQDARGDIEMLHLVHGVASVLAVLPVAALAVPLAMSCSRRLKDTA